MQEVEQFLNGDSSMWQTDDIVTSPTSSLTSDGGCQDFPSPGATSSSSSSEQSYQSPLTPQSPWGSAASPGSSGCSSMSSPSPPGSPDDMHDSFYASTTPEELLDFEWILKNTFEANMYPDGDFSALNMSIKTVKQ